MNLEQVPNTFPHLFVGYSIIFSILAVYVVLLSKKTTKLEKKLESIEQANAGQLNK